MNPTPPDQPMPEPPTDTAPAAASVDRHVRLTIDAQRLASNPIAVLTDLAQSAYAAGAGYGGEIVGGEVLTEGSTLVIRMAIGSLNEEALDEIERADIREEILRP